MILQQALHGYRDGHQLLAGSSVLPPRDAKLMLVLSDVSGPGAQSQPDGYLTAYPLLETKAYALARTWSAPEMSRPGCVWTHTLLIDFADLALLADPVTLLSLFRKPNGDTTAYRREITLAQKPSASPLASNNIAFAQLLLAELYDKPSARLVTARPWDGVDVDATILAIWAQQWPRLRRAFRFSTLSAMDRSTEGCNFDLQLYAADLKHQRSRFQDVIYAEPPAEVEQWVTLALDDLQHPNQAKLRAFLRTIGSDIDLGRDSFAPLCRLYQLTATTPSDVDAFETAVTILNDTIASHQSTNARRALVQAAFSRLDHLGPHGFTFLLEHLHLAGTQLLQDRGHDLCVTLWKRAPAQFAALLLEHEIAREVAAAAIETLTIDDLVAGLIAAPLLVEATLSARPQVITEPALWEHDLLPLDLVLPLMDSDDIQRRNAIEAMIRANRSDLVRQIVHHFDLPSLLHDVVAVQSNEPSLRKNAEPWLTTLALYPEALASFLAQEQRHDLIALSLIAERTRPDAVPNSYGTDPWVLALGTFESGAMLDAYLSSYLLSRALGRQSRNSAELAASSFETVYNLVRENRLPDSAWLLLDGRLPWSYLWLNWDRCQRLRMGVADLFSDRGLSADHFLALSRDEDTFAQIVQAAARTTNGRRYLNTVRKAIRHDGAVNGRLKVLDAAI
jgi:hypothetical protein